MKAGDTGPPQSLELILHLTNLFTDCLYSSGGVISIDGGKEFWKVKVQAYAVPRLAAYSCLGLPKTWKALLPHFEFFFASFLVTGNWPLLLCHVANMCSLVSGM